MNTQFPTTIAASACPIVTLVEQAGVDPQKSMGNLQIDYRTLCNSTAVIPENVVGRMSSLASQITNNNFIGWDAGLLPDLSDLHPNIKSRLDACRSVREVLAVMISHAHLQSSHMSAELFKNGKETQLAFKYSLPKSRHSGYHHVIQRICARIITILRTYAFPDWWPTEVTLDKNTVNNRAELAEFEAKAGFKIQKAVDENYLTIPVDANTLPDALFDNTNPPLIDDLQNFKAALSSLYKLKPYTRAEIIEMFGVSERTMERNLKNLGTRFNTEYNIVQGAAINDLLGKGHSVAKIAGTLNISTHQVYNLSKKYNGLSMVETKQITKQILASSQDI